MKKYALLALALVLTASLLAGCGCTNQNMGNTSAPTVLPTNDEVWNTTQSTTATTLPTMTQSTEQTHATIDRGNGPLEDPTVTVQTDGEDRARQATSSQP